MYNVSHFSLFLFTVCLEDYTDNYGEINSPNYPRNYPNNFDCTYRITVGFNEQIELDFVNFELEEGSGQQCFDFLEIRYGFYFIITFIFINNLLRKD